MKEKSVQKRPKQRWNAARTRYKCMDSAAVETRTHTAEVQEMRYRRERPREYTVSWQVPAYGLSYMRPEKRFNTQDDQN